MKIYSSFHYLSVSFCLTSFVLAQSMSAVAAPTPSGSGTYTPDQLANKAIHQSFKTQIEFQKVLKASATARLAALNLVPHITMNSIVEILTPLAFLGVLKTANDLVPFLLPSKWSAVKTQGAYRDAEKFSLLTEKADAGQIAEILSYSILMNNENSANFAENKKTITILRDQIKEREKTGIYQVGTSDDITAILNSIDVSTSDIVNLNANAYTGLAEAVGFQNPHAIQAVVEDTGGVSVENPASLNEAKLRSLAIARSTELRQLDFLIVAFQSDQVGRAFEWMDPKGNPDGGLGIGLPTFVKIDALEVDHIRAQRRETVATTSEKVAQTMADLKKAADQYKIAAQGKLIQERRIARITNNINLGIAFALADLVTAFQGRLQSESLMTQSKYAYLSAWGRLNRLLYAGPYKGLSATANEIPTEAPLFPQLSLFKR
jgi:hypothetical protein